MFTIDGLEVTRTWWEDETTFCLTYGDRYTQRQLTFTISTDAMDPSDRQLVGKPPWLPPPRSGKATDVYNTLEAFGITTDTPDEVFQ